MRIDFKPCPFCGGTNIVFKDYDKAYFGTGSYCVRCEDCDSSTGTYKSEEDALLFWNRRRRGK